FGNDLAVEFEHESQYAMRGRVRRAHIEDHFFADIVVGMMQLSIRRHPSRHGVRRFNLTRRKRHEEVTKLKGYKVKKNTFMLASEPARASEFVVLVGRDRRAR